MKICCAALGAVFAFILAAQLSAAQTAPAAAPALTPAPALCAASSFRPQLPRLSPVPPIFASSICGPCSDSYCQGHNTNSICFVPGALQQRRCFLVDSCSNGSIQCACNPFS